MHYRVGIEQVDDYHVYLLSIGADTPLGRQAAERYADSSVSAEGKEGIRHHVLLKDEKLIQLQLHQMERCMSFYNHLEPSLIPMPRLDATLIGELPSLVVSFVEPDENARTVFALHSNVFFNYRGDDIAQVFITDVYRMIADVD